MIDMRSDTVTRPTAAMLQAMVTAPLGDDVYGEDPTVNALEAEVAALLGKDAALLVPTGTMANQIALRCHTQPGDAVLLEQGAHILQWESGAPAVLSGVTLRPVPGQRGILDVDAVAQAVARAPDVHVPPITLLAVENTANAGGGTPYPLETLHALVGIAQAHGLRTHCDGARLWNAAAALGVPEATLVAGFDTVSVCLSKGLGAPVGSLLAGPADLIMRARRFRKMLGGGMRQAGVLAAAGRYAIDHHRVRLAEDHARAVRLAAALAAQGWSVRPPATNMVYLEQDQAAALVAAARAAGLRVGTMGTREVRLVVHLDISDADIEAAIAVFAGLRAVG